MRLYSDEYERALLGCMLFDNSVIDEVRSQVAGGDFHSQELGRLYGGILSSYEKNRACDLRMLMAECPGADKGVMASLTDEVSTAANFNFYAQKVKHLSMAREASRICGEGREKILSLATPDKVAEVIAGMERDLSLASMRDGAGKAVSVKEALLEFVNMVEDRSRFDRKYIGFETGFEKLDDILDGLPERQLTILGARPSIGKTAFAMNMFNNLASKGVPVCMFSLEMSTQELIVRSVAGETGISPYKLKHGWVAQSQQMMVRLQNALGRMYDRPMTFFDSEKAAWSLPAIRAQMRAEARKGTKAFFIDHLGLIRLESDLDRWRQVHEITWGLKQSAKELGVAVVLLCQLKRDAEGKEPALNDLRESGDIEQDADVIMFLDRKRLEEDVDRTDAKLKVAKNRNGSTGACPLYFYPSLTKFEGV